MQLPFIAIMTIGSLIGPSSPIANAAEGPASLTVSTALAVLGSVTDSASNRSWIVINDFGSIWRAAGLPVPLTVRQLVTKTGVDATRQMAPGSAAGSLLWDDVLMYPAPLGYPVLDLDQEIEIGPATEDLGVVWGPISQPAVIKALKKIKPDTTMVGTELLFDLGSQLELTRPAPFDQEFLSTRFVAVPKGGGHLVTGGRQVASSAVTALTDGATVPKPLLHDRSISAVLNAFGPTFESLAMGTTFIAGPKAIFYEASPAARAQLESRSGLSQLHVGPVMVGVAYIKGAPHAEAVVAAALYPAAADAQTAAKTVAQYTASGYSYRESEPYRKLWRVNQTTVHGRLVVMDLTTTSPGSVTQALISSDFPLFWSP